MLLIISYVFCFGLCLALVCKKRGFPAGKMMDVQRSRKKVGSEESVRGWWWPDQRAAVEEEDVVYSAKN